MTRLLRFKTTRTRFLALALLATMATAPAAQTMAAPAAPMAPEAPMPPDFDERLEAAEARLDEAARQLRQLYKERYEGKGKPKKAMLGVLVEFGNEGKKDAGVRLSGITPGGGAEAAGLKPKDVLVSINGVRLDDPNDDRSSMKALTSIMRDVTPGDSVVVGYRRGDAEDEAVIETRAHHKDLNALLDKLDIDIDIDADELGDDIAAAAESIAMSALTLAGSALQEVNMDHTMDLSGLAKLSELKELANLEQSISVSEGSDHFVDLDADLASYFGVDAGVLTVAVPEDGSGGLKAGDVVLALDGEAVQTADEVRERLSSAEGTVPLDVLRRGEKLSLSVAAEDFTRSKRISVIRIESNGENVEVNVEADDG